MAERSRLCAFSGPPICMMGRIGRWVYNAIAQATGFEITGNIIDFSVWVQPRCLHGALPFGRHRKVRHPTPPGRATGAVSSVGTLAAEQLPDAAQERHHADADDLGELEHDGGGERKQAELLRRDAADQRRDAVGGDVVGRRVEVLVVLAGVVGERRQQRAGRRLVGADALRISRLRLK